MRAKGRKQGRFVALSGLKKLSPPPGSPYPLLIVDARGLPVFFLCEWYHRRSELDPGRTTDTYLDMLLPWAGFLLRHEYAWNAAPDRIRTYLVEFLREDAGCLVAPDTTREDGLFVETTGRSPLAKSSLGVLLAALRSLYDTLIAAGYYPYQNPMQNERMIALKREHIRQIKNAGAPNEAGIRAETWSQTHRAYPTNHFRQRRGRVWEPDVVLEPEVVQERIAATIDFMVRHAPFLRDQVILLLLRQTGARLSEVLEMTVGGYRAAHHAGRALVKNKGSRGREEKMIYFTPTIERLLHQYVRTERAAYDPYGRSRLDALSDADPLFLTRTGKPYTRAAFYYHWKKLFAPAQQQMKKVEQVAFTPHDLRHLRVTRTVTTIRREAKGDAAHEAALLEGFQLLMGWRSPLTMATYLKTMNKREALRAVLADEEAQARPSSLFPKDGQERQPDHSTEPERIDPEEEFGWYEEEE
jgi:hypothetical protein